MKILNLIETLDFGGAELLILNNLSWLKEHTDWDLEVAVLFGRGEIAPRLKEKGIKVNFIKLSSRYNFIEAVFKIRRLIKGNHYDILHTHLFHANLYGRLSVISLIKNAPMVITSFHNPDYSYEDNRRFTFKIRKLLDYWTYKGVNFRGVAVSKAVRDDYQHHFKIKDLKVIYNSYSPFWAENDNADKVDIKNKLGFKQDLKICTTVARFSRQKGYDIYIKAIKEITKVITDIKFIFIGIGKEFESIKQLVFENDLSNYILFLGRLEQEEVRKFVLISDLFVLPSRFEAFGISALEAMATGTVVLATDTGGLRELIKDGVNGILVKPEDYRELAKKIIWALGNEDTTLKITREAINYARSNFSRDKIGNLWKEFYENSLLDYRKT